MTGTDLTKPQEQAERIARVWRPVEDVLDEVEIFNQREIECDTAQQGDNHESFEQH